MVLYFTPINGAETNHSLYMGRDKVENEDLIKWGLPEDVWCVQQPFPHYASLGAHGLYEVPTM